MYGQLFFVKGEMLMSIRVQVILEEEEVARFKSQAKKVSKSLSAWLRDAGKTMIELDHRKEKLLDPQSLEKFFQDCMQREKGVEPDWEEHKKLIIEGYRAGKRE